MRDGTNIYHVKPSNIHNIAMHIRCCNVLPGYGDDKHQEKTIILIGLMGTGKSTLIDAMINYIAGVSFFDDYRFKLVHLTEEEKTKHERWSTSQTNGITCYRIPWRSGSRVDYKLCVIDTPGFGNYSVEDETITSMLKCLFEKGIGNIDAICLVVPLSSQPDKAGKFLLLNIFKHLFSKDIYDIIYLFLTWDDGGENNVFDVLKKYIPIEQDMCFRFNNCDVLRTSHSNEHSIKIWRTRNRSFCGFFRKLLTTPSISLSNTKAVLDSKSQIERVLEKT
ncbi:uncharacterized protein LOC127717427 [Mytilus californianus]|uniref:uncharacterized protein LOC127717427 n=1 Tax=Mytilus californianus TaxID=6549 RepID=UPI0022484A2B|nr:uncharacterized protein LOC127717427 [Mytilus californianus]